MRGNDVNSQQNRIYEVRGVIESLHFQKAGQDSARYRALHLVALSAVLLSFGWSYLQPEVGPAHGQTERSTAEGGGGRADRGTPGSAGSTGPMLPPGSPSGFIGKFRVLRERPADQPSVNSPLGHSMISLGLISDSTPAPPVLGSNLMSLGGDGGWGLPELDPLWKSALLNQRHWGYPGGIGATGVDVRPHGTPPHARLLSPAWPRDALFLWDTVVVEGFVTLHSYGLISFYLTSESHPNLGFAEEVQRAMSQSTCYPATDKNGDRISVRCPFRCAFVRNSESDVWVDWTPSDKARPYEGQMTATVRER